MRVIDDPQPGFYRVRLCRGGPWVPCEIWHDGKVLHAYVGSAHLTIAGHGSRDPFDLWPYAQPIEETHYRRMVERIERLFWQYPDAPECHPLEPVKLNLRLIIGDGANDDDR